MGSSERVRVVKFFTTPPRPYPYVLINVRRPEFTYVKNAEEIIIDSGVEMFRNPQIKDYPPDHTRNLLNVYFKTKLLSKAKQIYVTVPDYPDDYHPKSLWLSDSVTNIERTVENVLKYTEKYPYVTWLIPVQGWNRKPESVLRSVKLYREHGIIDKFDYFAVGNLCVEPDVEVIFITCKLLRNELRDKKIHVFGLKLPALKYVYHLIDSFDSMAWTRPVFARGHSCKTTKERIEYFEEWLKRYERIVRKARNKPLDSFAGHDP